MSLLARAVVARPLVVLLVRHKGAHRVLRVALRHTARLPEAALDDHHSSSRYMYNLRQLARDLLPGLVAAARRDGEAARGGGRDSSSVRRWGDEWRHGSVQYELDEEVAELEAQCGGEA